MTERLTTCSVLNLKRAIHGDVTKRLALNFDDIYDNCTIRFTTKLP